MHSTITSLCIGKIVLLLLLKYFLKKLIWIVYFVGARKHFKNRLTVEKEKNFFSRKEIAENISTCDQFREHE